MRSAVSPAAAVAAGLFAVLAGAVARYAVGGRSSAEHLFNLVVALTPGMLESKAIAAFATAAKPTLFALCILTVAGAYAAAARMPAIVPGRWARQGAPAGSSRAMVSWPRLAALTTFVGVLAILASNGVAGTGGRDAADVLRSFAVLIAVNAAYLGALALLVAAPPLRDSDAAEASAAAPTDEALTRRAAIAHAGRVGLAAVSAGMVAWLWRRASKPLAAVRGAGPLRPPTPAQGVFAREALRPIVEGEITPTGTFYRVSKNAIDPEPNASDWSLRVEGMVERPMTLRAADFEARSAEPRYHTLECISNEIGDSYIGNAAWSGIRLMTLLEEAGISNDARYVNFLSADGYVESITIAQAAEALLATRMNGEPLQTRHGFPVRALVPGTYGKKNPKWITRIAASRDADVGFWKRLGWDSSAKVQTMARIDTPRNRAELALGEVALGGIAFAGDRAVRAVEWSADGGRSWHPTELRPALSPDSWVAWGAVWTPPGPGAFRIAARAIDGDGDVQTDRTRPAFPSGVTGHHVIEVEVRA